MTFLTSTPGAGAILTPAEVAALVVQPLIESAAITRAGTVVKIGSGSLRVPIVTGDPSAEWTAEGAEIAVSESALAEIDITPRKLAALSVISNELAADTSPAALSVVGAGMVRDLSRQLDAAAFGPAVPGAPSGLADLAGVNEIDATPPGLSPANSESFDWATSALGNAATRFTAVTSFVVHPDRWVALAQVKESQVSNRALLNPDPTSPTGGTIAGVPVIVSPAVDVDTAWAIPAAHVLVVVREDATVVGDGSVFFTSDRQAIRATLIVGFGFPHPAAISKVTFPPLP